MPLIGGLQYPEKLLTVLAAALILSLLKETVLMLGSKSSPSWSVLQLEENEEGKPKETILLGVCHSSGVSQDFHPVPKEHPRCQPGTGGGGRGVPEESPRLPCRGHRGPRHLFCAPFSTAARFGPPGSRAVPIPRSVLRTGTAAVPGRQPLRWSRTGRRPAGLAGPAPPSRRHRSLPPGRWGVAACAAAAARPPGGSREQGPPPTGRVRLAGAGAAAPPRPRLAAGLGRSLPAAAVGTAGAGGEGLLGRPLPSQGRCVRSPSAPWGGRQAEAGAGAGLGAVPPGRPGGRRACPVRGPGCAPGSCERGPELRGAGPPRRAGCRAGGWGAPARAGGRPGPGVRGSGPQSSASAGGGRRVEAEPWAAARSFLPSRFRCCSES
ncbi:collagen alpha-1(I) chain-like [Falco cherrug]|uniref:collagen alpha-1(I) chain-like n=1 Tax=Falco cherrug TaxID=345164 RepID=UPI002478ED8C|nr:collagen alpha-1(I) chain-like [Falco cherrug]